MTRTPSAEKLEESWSRSMPSGTEWICLKSSVLEAPAPVEAVTQRSLPFSLTVMFSGEYCCMFRTCWRRKNRFGGMTSFKAKSCNVIVRSNIRYLLSKNNL